MTTSDTSSPAPARAGRLRGIIFDLDGTIADTEEVHRAAFNAAFEDLGLPVRWSAEEHRRRLPQGSGRERLDLLFAEEPLASLFPPDRRAEAITRLHQRKTERFTVEVDAGRVDIRPGIRRLMEEAVAAGVTIAVASTAHRRAVHAVLRVRLGADLYGRFAAIYSGNDVTLKKPHPEIYLRTLADMGLPAGSVVALEDTRIGLSAAVAAGLATVVTFTHWTDDQDFQEAALVADSLGEPGGPACRVTRGPGWAAGRTWLGLAEMERVLSGGLGC